MPEMSPINGFDSYSQTSLPENAGTSSGRFRMRKGLAGVMLAASGVSGLAGCSNTGTPEKAPTTTVRVPGLSETYPPALAGQSPGNGSSNSPDLSSPTPSQLPTTVTSTWFQPPLPVEVTATPVDKPWVEVSGQCDDDGLGITIKSGNFLAGSRYYDNVLQPDGQPYTQIINGGNARVQSDGRLTATWQCSPDDLVGEWTLYIDAAGKDGRFHTADDQQVTVKVEEPNVKNHTIFTTAG